jgi:hypothetical protein
MDFSATKDYFYEQNPMRMERGTGFKPDFKAIGFYFLL